MRVVWKLVRTVARYIRLRRLRLEISGQLRITHWKRHDSPLRGGVHLHDPPSLTT